MRIVTLTTDFGNKDYAPALIKGAILSEFSQVQLVDITHNIENYNIVQGAFILGNVWHSFPEKTIHLISVNDFYSTRSQFLATEYKGHYFVGPNNGVFSLLFEEQPSQLIRLSHKNGSSTFPLKETYGKAIGQIAQDIPFAEIGQVRKKMTQRLTLQAITGASFIRGSVIYIDNFDNVVTNIPKDLFEKIGQGRSFNLTFKRHEPMTVLSNNYFDVPLGEPLCLFNSAGLLEIAINFGKAGSLLGLKLEDSVQIDFE